VIRTRFLENYITIAVILLHPLSRGYSYITSANPGDPPAIDPRYLTEPPDVDLLARHTRFIETIAISQSLASMLKTGGKRTPSVANDLRQVPLDEVKEYVKGCSKKHMASGKYLCDDAKRKRWYARLRVWGTQNLRVVVRGA
jgi:choline dehydrogenase-like flavoprotein